MADRIKYVFIIIKENQTLDSLFSKYPNININIPCQNNDIIRLSTPSYDRYYPGSNSWEAAHSDYNNGFDMGEKTDLPFISNKGPYVTYSGLKIIKYYEFLASKGVLCNNFYSSVMGPSTPNHLHLMAATSGNAISDPNLLLRDISILNTDGSIKSHPLNFTIDEIPLTLPNLLERKGLTWSYFDESSITNLVELKGDGVTMLEALRNSKLYNTNFITNISNYDENFNKILDNGPVSNVMYIHPAVENSDHPLLSNIKVGVKWTQKVINQILQSKYWESCVIFVTWDDYGGFYDHVVPPKIDDLGLGFRVPCLILSPYVKKGYIDSTLYEHTSILKFCETIFSLPNMTTRDANAENMLNAFDFTQSPRSYSEFLYN
jgi:phospholipase C